MAPDSNAPKVAHATGLDKELWDGIDYAGIDDIRRLLEQGADPNVCDGDPDGSLNDYSLIVKACSRGDVEVVRLLITYGADVNIKGGFWRGALQAMANCGDLDIARLLIDSGANIEAKGRFPGNALQAAAFEGNLDMAKLLIESGAEVNATGGFWGTALQTAAKNGKLDTVKFLITHAADVNAQEPENGNALFLAARYANLEMVQYLLEHGAKVDFQPWLSRRSSLLHRAIQSNNLAIVSTLCEAGGDIHMTTQDEYGRTPLHEAVLSGNLEMVHYLLERGASADMEDSNEIYPIQSALRKYHKEIVLELYQRTLVDLPSISASDWRSCSTVGDLCTTVIYKGQGRGIEFMKASDAVMMNDVKNEFGDKRWRFEHMNRHSNDKCMFMLADGRQILPDPSETSAFYRQWMCSGVEDTWVMLDDSMVYHDQIRKADQADWLLYCALLLTCYVLPNHEQAWPSIQQIEEKKLDDFMSREGFSWIMTKRNQQEVRDENKHLLESRIYFSSLECGSILSHATDLLPYLEEKLRLIWRSNYQRLQRKFSTSRIEILRASGNRPELIRDLLHDAQLLEYLKENFSAQMERLKAFEQEYLDDSSRFAHEMPLEQLKSKIKDFSSSISRLRENEVEPWLKSLAETSQGLIQLEFNLTSITEAQKSTSTNRSLKRLTWVTFIFLPLLFVASLFGMNVDVLKNNPGWWWYPVLAVATTILTFAVWIKFKRSNTLEGKLEKNFGFLFRSAKSKGDLESQNAAASPNKIPSNSSSQKSSESSSSRRSSVQESIADQTPEQKKRKMRDQVFSAFGKKRS